jgi:hypothetical protein
MSVSFENLLVNSKANIDSFVILEKTKCMKQISDIVFECTDDFVDKNEVYDGEIICKRNNNFYLFIGYDDLLEYEMYVPILFTDNIHLNIMKLKDYINS